MNRIRTIPALAVLAFWAAACSPSALDSSSVASVGPSLASDSGQADGKPVYTGIRLDVIVPVFEPGLPEDPDDYEEENIWPELRRTEANRFAVSMKSALEDTGVFGDVLVAPDTTASGDLYVRGRIRESNGEDVEIGVEVVDITGRRWFRQNYSHRVKAQFHRDLRNKGLDPYAPVFEEAAADIARALRKKSDEDLAKLRAIEEMRWAATFSQEQFGGYLQERNGVYRLAGLPDQGDPALARTRAIHLQDRLFMNRMQEHYEGFAARTERSYSVWQEQSLEESKARREASVRAAGQFLLGSLALIAGVAAAVSDTSSSGVQSGLGTVGAVVGGVLIAEGFQTRSEARVHRDALSELGESLDLELSPQVVAFEDKTLSLSGDAREQFREWRDFLKTIYDEETTPQREL